MRLVAVAASLSLGCAPSAIEGTQVRMDFTAADLYAAPFPSEHRRYEDGTVDLSAFPNPYDNAFVGHVVDLVDGEIDGFGNSAGVVFSLTDPIDAALPDVFTEGDVFLIGVDGPDEGARIPVDVAFAEDGGPYGAVNQLTLLPLQGRPLRSGSVYAAVVTRDVVDGVSLSMARLARGRPVDGLDGAAAEHYARALDVVEASGVDRDEVAGIAVFRTWDPWAGLEAVVADMLSRELPAPTAFSQTDVFDGYCVYRAEIELPVYQAGEPPYTTEGGGIVFVDGAPVVQHTETAAIWVTVPEGPAPDAGWPVVVMIPTGGGGDRPLVDRGVHAEPHGESIEPGTGPAWHFAAAGYAGVSVDGPHGGVRNVSGGDQQLLMFNMGNPAALLDNVRQSAAEAALQAHLLDAIAIDASDCGGGTATFDTSRLALFGHSMGASIAVPAAAVEPRYRAVILSGAGGSWLANVVYKQSPLPVRDFADVIVGYGGTGRTLTEHDPVLSLVQWAGEATDAPLFGSGLHDRHVLMFQGVVDTYILPPIANPLTLSLGLDVLAPVRDEVPEHEGYRTIEPLLPFSGGAVLDGPVSANREVTAVLVQHVEDGIEDGHEVFFQRADAQAQYREFLATWADGAPVVSSTD